MKKYKYFPSISKRWNEFRKYNNYKNILNQNCRLNIYKKIK